MLKRGCGSLTGGYAVSEATGGAAAPDAEGREGLRLGGGVVRGAREAEEAPGGGGAGGARGAARGITVGPGDAQAPAGPPGARAR